MTSPANVKPLRVLSLDGGGMRGLYTATLLDRLAKDFQQSDATDIGSAFDVIVGTSTGGILATALAAGVPISKVIELYRKTGPIIFKDPQPSPIGMCGKWNFIQWCWRNRRKAANDVAPLRETLENLLGKETFAELYERRKIALCLTAVKILDEKFRVFKTPHIPDKIMDRDLPLVEACLATGAAPIFLPLASVPVPQQHGHFEVFADGGLAANNPVLVGLIEALQLVGETRREIEIFSIGTCSAPDGAVLAKTEVNRGLFDWKVGAKALGLSMNAQASAANYAAGFLAQWLREHGFPVQVIRFPEERRSEANLQFLKLDLASDNALNAFTSFGHDDAVAAYRLFTDGNDEGLRIQAAFSAMNKFEKETTS